MLLKLLDVYNVKLQKQKSSFVEMLREVCYLESVKPHSRILSVQA